MTNPAAASCELCAGDGGSVLLRTELARVVLVADPLHPGFCRVIANAHVAEMTDLPPAARAAIMDLVFAVEAALRAVLAPHKINLASLGNVTPHVHWHVIPRFRGDPHFPNPVWGERRPDGRPIAAPADLETRLVHALRPV
jgi:diadenosine tetraphosphate (Ap4A) HIT family hydrolase